MALLPRVVSTFQQPIAERVLEPGHDADPPPPRVRQTVAALLLLVGLVALGLWLTGALRGAAIIQDCVAAGRTNCAPIR